MADIPDLAPCSALGAMQEEALAGILVAKAAWLESARAHGHVIPEPRYRPAPVRAAG